MTNRKPLTEKSLKVMNVPRALREELLEVDALNLDWPMPTEGLVKATLDRCKEALNLSPELKPEAGVIGAEVVEGTFAALIGGMVPTGNFNRRYAAFCESFANQAVSFARENPEQTAVVVVDNFAAVDPERWLSDPSLALLDCTLRGAEVALELESGQPIDRVIIARDDPSTYDEKELRIIRQAIVSQPSSNTYLVAARRMSPMGKYQCTVIGNEVVLEFGKGDSPGVLVDESQSHRNPGRAGEIRAWVETAKSRAVRLKVAGQLEDEVEFAIRSSSTRQLLNILMSAK